MCSFFGVDMDNYQGDLTDIIRASGGALSQSDVSNWEFASDLKSAGAAIEDCNKNSNNVFGDPFCSMRDPLLHELNVAAATGSGYFSSTNSTDHMLSISVNPETSTKFSSSANNFAVFEEEMINKSSLFSRIQISPSGSNNNNNINNSIKLPISPCGDSPVLAGASSSSPRPNFKPSPMVSIDMINTNSSKSCLIENPEPVQISSPRNLGMKRRKSQAKKVICIPAPAAANSRSSGEVVPSDLWAWRKYGQKPIKGSPYPRGYYRCSSSKGCSARKQVERSRTDPNMLVITYTSEHNHPWPTQRNALAGSTRSQPTKNTSAAASSKSSPSSQPQKAAASTKEEQKESSNDTLSPIVVGIGGSCSSSTAVKEEIIEEIENQMLEIDESDQSSIYRPSLLPIDSSHQSEDFYADLGEIEADPLDLLFSQGFTTIGEHDHKESKGLDPFGLFDWSANLNHNNNNNISFGEEAKEGFITRP